MTITELEKRWKSIIYSGSVPYRSLRISSDCLPELYIAIDIKGARFLILQVPKGTKVNCRKVDIENISLEWHEDSRFIIIGLLNTQFTDLYNDLVLSLYNRIKNISRSEEYTVEFINSFQRWVDFFDESISNQLSEYELKGLFGELTVLLWLLNNAQRKPVDEVLIAWQGPYGKAQDFIFSNYNLEVKTKNIGEVSVRISSEFQLQPELGKQLQLGIVNVQVSPDGISVKELIEKIRSAILSKGADLSIFLKTLSKAGMGGSNSDKYKNIRFLTFNITFYHCHDVEFPKIITTEIQTGISQVKYNLNLSVLDPFINQIITLQNGA